MENTKVTSFLVVLIILILILSTHFTGAIAQEDNRNELPLGRFHGGASAGGISKVTASGMQDFTVDAFITSTFDFVVTTEEVTGTFDLTAEKLIMRGIFPEVGEIIMDMNFTPGSGGVISGARDSLDFFASTSLSGTATSSRGTFPIKPTEKDEVTINTTILFVYCETVNGNWDFSINTKLEEAQLSPTFSGGWVATRDEDEETSEQKRELVEGLTELLSEMDEYLASFGYGDNFDPFQFDHNKTLDLAQRSAEMSNQLQNLSECDRATLGEENLERWSTSLASSISDLVLTTAKYAQSQNRWPSYKQLFNLINSARVTGAIGPGSYLNQAQAFQTDEALRYLTSRSVEGHLGEVTGEGPYEYCSNYECQQTAFGSALGGVSQAVQNGWTLTVKGEDYPPDRLPELVDNPPVRQNNE